MNNYTLFLMIANLLMAGNLMIKFSRSGRMTSLTGALLCIAWVVIAFYKEIKG